MTVARYRTLDIARRRFLRTLAGAGAFLSASLAAGAASASTKFSQKLAHYQQTPNGKAHCEICKQFLTPPACQLVEGPIVPTGWCVLFAAKAA
jgi:hypothetical protein